MESYFRLSGHDNDSYAFFDRPNVRRCPQCGNLTHKWEESLTGLHIRKRRKLDISATYDGVLVVSEKFVQVCEENRLDNVVFEQLPGDRQFFAISSSYEVKFDAQRRRTVFENFCDVCNQWDAVAGADPVMLSPGQVVAEKSFARTDIEFGSGDEKHPILLCGRVAGTVLKASNLRGLEISTIAD